MQVKSDSTRLEIGPDEPTPEVSVTASGWAFVDVDGTHEFAFEGPVWAVADWFRRVLAALDAPKVYAAMEDAQRPVAPAPSLLGDTKATALAGVAGARAALGEAETA